VIIISQAALPQTPLITAPKSPSAECTFSDPLAAVLHSLGQNKSRKMRCRTAESIARKAREYSQSVGQEEALDKALIQEAWRKVAEKNSRSLLDYVRTRLAGML